MDTSGDCWLWTRFTSTGYGVMMIDHKPRRAHRISWELTYGPIRNGIQVCHRCDVRACVRPDHLFLGTQADNMHDMIAKGRAAPSEAKVHIGSAHPNAKLNEDIVREIRASTEPQRILALRYGVTVGTIKHVRARRQWKHVA